MSLVGIFSYRRLNVINKMTIKGMEYLDELPQQNVLFVANHQTYYTDVMALIHVFSAHKWKYKSINRPFYLLSPKARSYFVAAEETMKDSGWLPKIFAYGGAVTIKRTWRQKDETVSRELDIDGILNVSKALGCGWLINFPQGTTKKNAPIRKGAAQLIYDEKPIVVPVHINGFREAFDKTGLKIRKTQQQLSISFSAPKEFTEKATLEEIQHFLEKMTREK